MRKAVFFDLDGTLLPLDMEAFIRDYYVHIDKSGLFEMLGSGGAKAFDRAVHAMIKNDGRALNSEVFLETLCGETGAEPAFVLSHMDDFYDNAFHLIKAHTRTERSAVETVKVLKKKGYRLVLATNPLFPPVATDARIEWAGLNKKDFEYISYFDNSHYCKPNPAYFKEILKKTGLCADECYFVGNDVRDDMACLKMGFSGYLVLDHIIGDPREVPQCEQGDYSALLDFAKKLPPI